MEKQGHRLRDIAEFKVNVSNGMRCEARKILLERGEKYDTNLRQQSAK